MNGRRHQQKRGFKRVMVTLLTFVMLVSVCFPGMHVRAEDDVTIVTDAAAVEQDITKVEDTANASNVGGGEVTGDEEEGEGEEEPDLTSGQSLDNTANTSTDGDEEVNKDEPATADADTTTTGNSESTTVETPAKSDAVLAVEAQINALPTVTEFLAMESDQQDTAHAAYGAAKAAYDELGEEQSMVDEAVVAKLTALDDFFYNGVMPLIDVSNPDYEVSVKVGGSTTVGGNHNTVSVSSVQSYTVYDQNGNVVSNSGISAAVSSPSGSSRNLTIKANNNATAGTYYVQVTYRTSSNNSSSKTKLIKVEVAQSGDQSGSNYLSEDRYSATTNVYWDAVEITDSGKTGLNDTNGTYVTSVVMGGTAVKQANSTSNGGWSGGTTLGTHYGENATVELKVTPARGYYVTKVVVACCSQGSSSPLSCQTWSNGAAFVQNFDVGPSQTVTIPGLERKVFGHKSESPNYFVLVCVAPVPTPLYVEYNYGRIDEVLTADKLQASPFVNADQWTQQTNDNVLGTGRIETDYTQYAYMYDNNDVATAKNWRHYANTVSDEAKNVAAQAGYYFAGWEATYYSAYTEDSNGNMVKNEDGSYQFTTVYGSGNPVYNEKQEVALTTHVRLEALWAPIQLKVTKTVAGLPSTLDADQNYTLEVKKGDTVVKSVNVSATENGDYSAILCATADEPNNIAITPGTYTVTETVTGTAVTANTTKYYPVATVTVGSVEVTASSTIQELKVTNTYSAATPALKIVKEWKDASGNVVTDTSEFSPVNVVVTKNDNATKTVSLNFADGWTAVLTDVNPADVESVVETPVPTGYTATYSDGTTEFQEIDGTNYMLTVKKVTNTLTTTSITLDKVVTGNMGDWGKEFTFTITYGDTTVTKTMTHSTEIQTITDVPIGSTVTITESGNDGYTVSATVDDKSVDVTNNAITFTVGANGNAVVFTNNKDALIDTGIFTDTAPYIAFLSIAAIGAFLMLSKRRYNGAY